MNTDWSTVLLAVVTVVMVAVFICSLCMDKGGCGKLECDKRPFSRCNEKRYPMDLFEATEFAREYTPPVIYTITEIKEKGNISNRGLHEEMIDCHAYPLFLKVGERGWIMCKPSYDTKFHRVQTSIIQSCSSWGNGEDSVTIETMNTIYVLTKQ